MKTVKIVMLVAAMLASSGAMLPHILASNTAPRAWVERQLALDKTGTPGDGGNEGGSQVPPGTVVASHGSFSTERTGFLQPPRRNPRLCK